MKNHDAVGAAPTKLALVKSVHTLIYVVMAAATFYVFASGITGTWNRVVAVATGAVALEAVVFFANGMRCPLTQLARRYGDPKGYVGDTLFPESCTRHTFRVFGSLYVIGIVLIVLD